MWWGFFFYERWIYLVFLQTIGTKPVAHIDQFTADMLASAEMAEEVSLNGSGKLVKVNLPCFYLLVGGLSDPLLYDVRCSTMCTWLAIKHIYWFNEVLTVFVPGCSLFSVSFSVDNWLCQSWKNGYNCCSRVQQTGHRRSWTLYSWCTVCYSMLS